MKIYLDTCSLNRPLDDKRQHRVALEAEAVLAILALCEDGQVTLISSEVLLFEVDRNPHPERKAFVTEILALTPNTVQVTETMVQRAKTLEYDGLKPFDALHIAVAEASQVDFFCTCDDRLYRKVKSRIDVTVRVVSPLELAQEILP